MSIISVAILAGGQSRRMGTDKSFALLHGKPVFEHVLTRLSPLGLPVMVITNTPEKYVQYNIPMVADSLPHQGSLGGLFTAIQASATDYTLCVACDMPFLNTALLQKMIDWCDGWDVTVPCVDGFPETMHAIYRKTCLSVIGDRIARGKLKVSDFYTQMKVRYIEEKDLIAFDPDRRSFVNLNTPADLAAANQTDVI